MWGYPMTSDRDSFITGICESPEDDNLRLVYADWLEENGEADRAEFIRVQIAISLLREPEYKTARDLVPSIRNYPHGSCGACDVDRYCSYHALQAREKELLFSIRLAWFPAFPGWLTVIEPYDYANPNAPVMSISRGFVSALALPRYALPNLPAFLATQPIERITVEGVEVAIIKDRYGWQTWNTVWYNRATLVAGIGEWIESVLPVPINLDFSWMPLTATP